jgi:CRISP-associated protein Cas1
MLNYAYRMVESQVRIATVAAGLGPTIGFLHANREGRVALVYDLMEPLRPKVDRAVLSFVTSTTFTPKDFLLTEMENAGFIRTLRGAWLTSPCGMR